MKKIITFLLLIYAFSFRANNQNNLFQGDKIELRQETNLGSKFVIAQSGLNYRKEPKGEILGKFEYGEKLEISKRTNIFESISDEGKTIKGEWLGVKLNNDVVYVFSGYLSEGFKSELYEWYGEFCDYLSVYNSEKYSKEEIENSYKLFFENYTSFKNTPSIFKLSEIKNLDKEAFINEYLSKVDEIQKMKLPKNERIQKTKQKILANLEEIYKVYLIRYDAHLTQDFKVLDNFWESDDLIEEYSKALQGSDEDLLQAWENLTRRQAAINGSPEMVWDRYSDKRDSANWRAEAKLQVMEFGWWNAVNKYITYYEVYEHLEDFLALFTSTKEMGCEEP